MTTSSYAPGQTTAFPSIYGQPGFYGQPGLEQQSLSQFGLTPQMVGQQLFGQLGLGVPAAQQQFGMPQQQQLPPPQQLGPQQLASLQQQLGLPQQLSQQQLSSQQQPSAVEQTISVIVQLVPQLLGVAVQNLATAQQLVQQAVQQIVQIATQSSASRQQQSRQYGGAW